MKTTKTKIAGMALSLALFLASCGVQQYAVNTKTEPFANGGRIFGEKTQGLEFQKKREIFIIGINAIDIDTKQLAEKMNAGSYTIESKSTFFSYLVLGLTGGIINYKVIKVIKRTN